MLTRESFFALPPELPFEDVETLAGRVRVRALTAGERDAFEIAHARAESRDFRARMIVATCRNGDDSPVFSEADIPALSKRPAFQLEPMIEAAIRVNRMSDKDAEALRKN